MGTHKPTAGTGFKLTVYQDLRTREASLTKLRKGVKEGGNLNAHIPSYRVLGVRFLNSRRGVERDVTVKHLLPPEQYLTSLGLASSPNMDRHISGHLFHSTNYKDNSNFMRVVRERGPEERGHGNKDKGRLKQLRDHHDDDEILKKKIALLNMIRDQSTN